VTYDENGSEDGTVPVDSNNYIYGDTVTVLENSGGLTRTDYTFDGWNTASDGSGTDYSPGATFTMDASDVTLYARWRLMVFTFIEDWEDGVWDDSWEDDRTTGDTVSIYTGPAYSMPPGNRSLSIRDNSGWEYLDGLHYEFTGGIQPGYISFFIRKTNDQWCSPRINIGNDNTAADQGSIYFRWLDNNSMSVLGSDTVSASPTAFHHVEFVNIDFTSQTYDFRMDGSLITAGVPFYNPASSFTRFYISVGWYVQDAYIDDIEIWE
jgi:uncharacterized repeat protein (TIGR02543 family)